MVHFSDDNHDLSKWYDAKKAHISPLHVVRRGKLKIRRDLELEGEKKVEGEGGSGRSGKGDISCKNAT